MRSMIYRFGEGGVARLRGNVSICLMWHGEGVGEGFLFSCTGGFLWFVFKRCIYIYILVNIELIERESSLSRVSTIQYFIFYFYEKE